jgi:PDDEXK-like domain of unknown function (DUF3799)
MLTESGIYEISAAEYHSDPCPQPSLSSSVAKILLEQSALHAFHAHSRLSPAFERDESSAFDLGSAAHMLLLERRSDGIVIVQADDWRTKVAKESRDLARAEGKFPILAHQYDRADRMVRAAYEFIDTTELAGIFQLGLPERTIVWQEGSIWCRCRPDLMMHVWNGDTPSIVLDYKTTENAEPEAFIRQIGRMGYDVQAEFYLRGTKAVTGVEPVFIFLAQETSTPHACSLISLSNSYRAIAQEKVSRAIRRWTDCMSTGIWPSYGTQLCYAEPKPWELEMFENAECAL